MTTCFKDCVVFDGVSSDLIDGGYVVIEGERIREVGKGQPPRCKLSIDCSGRFLMPGLIDAHVHAYAPTFSFYDNDRMPASLLVAHAVGSLQAMLARGFTSVRDAGGGDVGLAMAIEHGLIVGPRFFYSGKAISQTGGHGDMRPGTLAEPCGCSGYSGSISRVADGVDEVRRAVREELRNGAHQIKLFVSGGVASPTDPIWMNQFTSDEIRAAVQEAHTRRSYVMAHCHTDEAVRRCIDLGVRSVEHGTQIAGATAQLIVERDAYVVPTLSVARIVRDHGKSLGLPQMSLEKIRGVFDEMLRSIENCVAEGVKLGLGSDILGVDFQHAQGGELELRGSIQKPIDVLRSATSINAALLQREGELGCIAPGALADILIMHDNPLSDLSLFKDPAHNIPVIMRGGVFVRNDLEHINV